MGVGCIELMKVFYGVLLCISGYVILDGYEVVICLLQDGLVNGIVYIFEDCKCDGLVLGMLVKENMLLIVLCYFSCVGGSLKYVDEQQVVSDFICLFNVKILLMEQVIGLFFGGNQ